jgi:hypothetical protein
MAAAILIQLKLILAGRKDFSAVITTNKIPAYLVILRSDLVLVKNLTIGLNIPLYLRNDLANLNKNFIILFKA